MLEGKKILFVEDEVDMLTSLKYKFKYMEEVRKVIPLFALNLAEGDNMIQKENPDLTYLDLCLCENNSPNGLELLKKYGKSHNIIVVSGYVNYEDECLGLGAKGYIVKPIKFNDIMATGEKILNSLAK